MSKINIPTLLLTILISCNTKENKNNIQNISPFHQYIEDTFSKKLILKPYIFIIGKRMCKLCEAGVSSQFKKQQKLLNPKKILMITDLHSNDSLFINKFKESIIVDSTSNFENYNFPRSYITIYKINDDSIIDYVYFSNKNKLTNFLKQENLLVEEY